MYASPIVIYRILIFFPITQLIRRLHPFPRIGINRHKVSRVFENFAAVDHILRREVGVVVRPVFCFQRIEHIGIGGCVPDFFRVLHGDIIAAEEIDVRFGKRFVL